MWYPAAMKTLMAVLFLSACVQAKEPFSVLVIGDSTSAVTESAPYPYAAILQMKLGEWVHNASMKYSVFNGAVRGDYLDTMLWRYRNGLSAVKHKYCIFLGGINGIELGGQHQLDVANELLLAMKSDGCKNIVITPFPFKGSSRWSEQAQSDMDAYIYGLKSISAKNGFVFVDIRSLVGDGTQMYTWYDSGDHLHPNELAHHAVAIELLKLFAH